jgi:membrane protein required for beta-lactamase induction
MTKEYNWKAILAGAIPVSIVMGSIFYSNFSMNAKWLYLALGMIVSIGITYYMDKKKHNIFTAPFIVLIISLMVYGLRQLGFV